VPPGENYRKGRNMPRFLPPLPDWLIAFLRAFPNLIRRFIRPLNPTEFRIELSQGAITVQQGREVRITCYIRNPGPEPASPGPDLSAVNLSFATRNSSGVLLNDPRFGGDFGPNPAFGSSADPWTASLRVWAYPDFPVGQYPCTVTGIGHASNTPSTYEHSIGLNVTVGSS
jgi:hypothetical protein